MSGLEQAFRADLCQESLPSGSTDFSKPDVHVCLPLRCRHRKPIGGAMFTSGDKVDSFPR
jgi:hypothetical protein